MSNGDDPVIPTPPPRPRAPITGPRERFEVEPTPGRDLPTLRENITGQIAGTGRDELGRPILIDIPADIPGPDIPPGPGENGSVPAGSIGAGIGGFFGGFVDTTGILLREALRRAAVGAARLSGVGIATLILGNIGVDLATQAAIEELEEEEARIDAEAALLAEGRAAAERMRIATERRLLRERPDEPIPQEPIFTPIVLPDPVDPDTRPQPQVQPLPGPRVPIEVPIPGPTTVPLFEPQPLPRRPGRRINVPDVSPVTQPTQVPVPAGRPVPRRTRTSPRTTPGPRVRPSVPSTSPFALPFVLPFVVPTPRVRPRIPTVRVQPPTPTPTPTPTPVPLPAPIPRSPVGPPRTRTDECVDVRRRRRRKGKCREGFFEERPGRTRFITWRTVDCITRRPI